MENNSIDLKVDIFEEEAGWSVSMKEKWENLERIFKRVEASIVDRERKVEVRERGVRGVERLLSEIKVREREIDERRSVLEERERKNDEREEEIDKRSDVLKAWVKEINEEGGVLDEREREIDERRTVLEEREQEFDERRSVLEEWEKEINERGSLLEEREQEFDEREKEIDERRSVLEEREREIDERTQKSVVLEEQEKEIDKKSAGVLEEQEWLVLRNKEMTQIIENLQLTHKKLKRLSNLRERKVVEICKDMEVGDYCQGLEKEEKQVNAPCKDLTLSEHGLVEKQINEPLESKETEVSHELKAKDINAICSLTQAGREVPLPPSDGVGIVSSTMDSSVCSDIHLLCKGMDRHSLRSYVIRCVKEDNDNLLDALRSVSDPTKLVLHISQSFFETDLDEADTYFFKIGCLHLLEQLIKLSPSITPDVEREARDYSDVWMKRLNDKTRGRDAPVNHFGFLHFVAAYKLGGYSGWNKLLQIFKSSYIAAKRYPPQKNVDLCRALGLTDKIPGFVRCLIKKQKPLEAVKCISFLKMECDFPPVPLIEAYLELRKLKVGEQIKKASLEGKEVFPDVIEVSHLTQALSDIQSLDLPSVFPTDSLSSRIMQLRKEINARKETTESSRKRQANSSGQLQKRPRV